MTIKPFHIKAVVFDFDGTLTLPGALPFDQIQNAIGCPPDMPILEFIESLPDTEQRQQAHATLDRFEADGAKNSKPNHGAEDLVRQLKSKGIKLGIITRNRHRSIQTAFEKFTQTRMADFDVILTRDDAVACKPEPDSILLAAEKLGVNARNMMMVGDFIFDVQAGRRAGAVTVFLSNGTGHSVPDGDFTVAALSELENIIRYGLPLGPGKLPNDMLELFLADFAVADESVLIRPGVGEDTAAVDLDRAEVLVLTSDPITFATDAIGRYAVVVNANDMATSGARPRWLLTTLLFPVGATPSEIGQTMHDLARTCRQWHITLCGGHTEITDAVNRPVVIGTMAGTVKRENLINKRKIETGDRVLLTKAISVEGTAIVAREFGSRLEQLGMAAWEVERCRKFLSQISILPEAGIAAGEHAVSAMHDITEGGLATALSELCIAGNCGIRVDMDAIPVFSETRKICRLLGMDPLGLIGSGSLLICCRENACSALMAAVRRANIAIACIGEVTEKGSGVCAVRQGKPEDWPQFAVDEITRLFAP